MRGGANDWSNQMRSRNIPGSARAQTPRAESTEAEKMLWRRLRDRRPGGAKFVRQAPIGSYYADFVCRACKFVVEVDGSQHVDDACDETRRNSGCNGLSRSEVLECGCSASIDGVCETIVAALEGRLTPFERFKQPMTKDGAAPHPALHATFSPPEAGRRG